MESFELVAECRSDLGKNASKRFRLAGQIPAVVYGEKKEPIHVLLNEREIAKFYRQNSRKNVLINLDIQKDGASQKITVLPKKFDRNAISLSIIHVDFIQIDPTHPIRTDVSISFVGVAPGVKKGGNMMTGAAQLRIKSLPADVPNTIEIDLSNLEVGQSIRVRDIPTNGLYEVLTSESEIIVYVEALKGKDATEEVAA